MIKSVDIRLLSLLPDTRQSFIVNKNMRLITFLVSFKPFKCIYLVCVVINLFNLLCFPQRSASIE